MAKKIVVIDQNICDFCGACCAVCKDDALILRDTSISVDHTKCTLCGKCITICPVRAPSYKENEQ